MYWCYNCEKRFEDPIEKHTTYENYYGLETPQHTPLTLCLCPYCGSEEIEEEVEEDE